MKLLKNEVKLLAKVRVFLDNYGKMKYKDKFFDIENKKAEEIFKMTELITKILKEQ